MRAKKLGLPPPQIITKPKLLFDSIMELNWRRESVLHGVPCNGQIFGRLLSMSGINGVKYQSKHTNKDCIAVFTKTFNNSTCSLKIAGDLPNEILVRQINSKNYKLVSMTAREINEVKKIQ